MRRFLTATLAIAALASSAAAAPSSAPEPVPAPPSKLTSVVTTPEWERRPTAEELQRYYPERASRLGIGGKVVMACTVAAEGLLTDCRIDSEDPKDQDFGAAALRMARVGLFKLKPTTADGAPVEGGTVRIPMTFSPPKVEAGAKQGGWITTGAPPPAMPVAGPFIHIWDEAATAQNLGMAGYLLLPDNPPVEGRIAVWTVVVVSRGAGPDAYVVGRHRFDCKNRTVSAPAMQLFSIDGALQGWTNEGQDWSRVAGDPFMTANLDLACGFAKPTAPTLPGLAAALADAKDRLTKDKP